MADRLKGRVVLVTGAGQGIGAGIANVMIQEGAIVVASDLRGASAAAAVTGAADAFDLDVTDPTQWARVAQEIERKYGRLDVLVNNAGIADCLRFEDTDITDLRRHLAVNVEGPFSGIKACFSLLRKFSHETRGGSAVVNIVSVAALLGLPDQCAYNISKGAENSLTRSLAVEFALKNYGIRVNAIHPGQTMTPMTQHVLNERAQDSDRPAIRIAPLERAGQPEDIAYGVVYLASDEAAQVTGAELHIDGGWTAW